MKPLVILSYLSVYLIWGSTYFFIKMSVETIPPVHALWMRYLLGAAFFLVLAALTGRLKARFEPVKIFHSAWLGILLLVGGTGLVTLAETRVESYLAALIIASTPLSVTLFDWVLVKKKISLVTLFGIVAGFSGVLFLLHDGNGFAFSLNPYLLLILLALILWSLGTSIGHKVKGVDDLFVNSAVQMGSAGLLLLVGGIVFYGPDWNSFSGFSIQSLLAVAYLGTFGSAAFVSYNYLIRNEPAIRVVTYAFVNPVIALGLGILIGGETPVRFLLPGILLVLLGLFVMFYGESAFKKLVSR